MSDKKISQLTGATTPLAGTEVLPIVQSGETRKASVESVLTSAQPSGVVNAIAYLNATKQLTYNAKYTFNGSVQTLLNPTYVNGGYASSRDSSSGGVYNTFDFIEGVTTTGYLRNYGSLYGSGLNNQIHLWNTQNADIVVGVNNATSGSFTTNGLAFPAGKGIDFSATTNAAGMTSELLNDYEEGTWTPVFADALTGGNASGTVMSGVYTKIGNLVTISFGFAALDASGMTGGNTAYFRSLPFATSATNETTTSPRLVGATFSGYVSALLGNSRSGFYLLEVSSGGAFSPLTVSDLASSDGTVTLQYFV